MPRKLRANKSKSPKLKPPPPPPPPEIDGPRPTKVGFVKGEKFIPLAITGAARVGARVREEKNSGVRGHKGFKTGVKKRLSDVVKLEHR